MKKKFKLTTTTLTMITTLAGLSLIAFNLNFFASETQLFSLLNLAAGAIIIGIPLLYRYYLFSKLKKIEQLFPLFLRDVTGNINTGMTLPQALRTAAGNNYDILTPYVKEMVAKISWGIPFETTLQDFGNKIGSKSMKRTVQTIIEAHKSGGTMNTVLEGVATALQELEKIKKERSASVYSQMINGYLIYIVFLGVMIGMSSFLLPAFQFGGATTGGLEKTFPEIFHGMVVIQGFFAGISIGKMSEGTILGGVKHSLVLSILGYTAFLLFG